jgi:predicted DNA-binding transcriptional regulator AlpA
MTANTPCACQSPSIMVSAAEAARLCGVSRTTWYALLSSGRCPAPTRLSGRVLWRRDELVDWCNAGCPSRDRWEVLRKGGR